MLAFLQTTFDSGFKMALYLLLVMLTVCAAVPQDLSGKMFTFPQPTNSAQVRLTTSRQVLSAVTVCLRSFTDLRRTHSLFSLATPSSFNDILIIKTAGNDFDTWIRNSHVKLIAQGYAQDVWHSFCVTWDSTSGLVQIWLDGKPSSRKLVSSGSHISGPIIVVLGQDQDSYGGGFDINQSFVGMLSDVHLWDHVLPPGEIQNYADQRYFTPGNVLSWNALEFQTAGRVLIEDK